MPAFKGTLTAYKYSISDVMAFNLREWIRYGLLEMGYYTNITFDSPVSGLTNAQSIHDDRYNDGQVYELFGPSIVYQSDVSTNSPLLTPPLVCSGIYINQQFLPLNTTGYYQYTLDFERGRVIFNNAQPSSGISAEYCINDVSTQLADTQSWKTLVSAYKQETAYAQIGQNAPSGLSTILKEKRVWLPSIFVDIQDRDHTPLQLGNGEYANFNVFYHVFSDKPSINKALIDVINDQENITLNLFDPNSTPLALNYDGSICSGLSYKTLSNRNGPYFWRNAFIEHSTARPFNGSYSVFRGEIKHRILLERYGFAGAN